jgi:hypothetical protein
MVVAAEWSVAARPVIKKQQGLSEVKKILTTSASIGHKVCWHTGIPVCQKSP